MRLTNYSQSRRAVTLVEVIFSIGVVLIGLVGLVAILPLAGNRAQEAMSMSAGSAVGDAVLKEIQLRRWIGNLGLVDFASGEALAYKPRLSTGPALTLTDTNTVPDPNPDDNPRIASICIDPMYVAEVIGQGDTARSVNGYSDVNFPYYSTTCDPLLNPSGPSTWPVDQPRMRRFGLRNAADFVRPYSTVGLEQARSIVESSNDLVVTRPNDRSASPQFYGLTTDSGLEYGRRAPSGEFSWIATISPLPGNKYASVSVVVIRNRDRTRDFPLVTETDPKKNGINERLAYVSFASGFRGGAGGTVHLTASANISSSLRVGQWVMLSRRVSIAPIVDVHRWFRVAAVDGDPQEFIPQSDTLLETGGAPLPNTTRTDPVWRHKVLLDGPDWTFGLNTAAFDDDTFATIMTDVVSVTERVIPLADL